MKPTLIGDKVAIDITYNCMGIDGFGPKKRSVMADVLDVLEDGRLAVKCPLHTGTIIIHEEDILPLVPCPNCHGAFHEEDLDSLFNDLNIKWDEPICSDCHDCASAELNL